MRKGAARSAAGNARRAGMRGAVVMTLLAVLLGLLAGGNSAAAAAAVPWARRMLLNVLAKISPLPGIPLDNWNHGQTSTPRVYAEAESIEDLIAVVKDTASYPSPVLAVGSRHSVTAVMTNPNGTIVSIAKMNKILEVNVAGGWVRVQTGVKLADLHDHLGKFGQEITYMPEIGDATVGSLTVSTSKDSSINGGLGYLNALVRETTYVDPSGAVVTLKRGRDDAELDAFSASFGTAGLVAELVLDIKPQMWMHTQQRLVKFDPSSPARDKEFARQVRALRLAHDNALVITDLTYGIGYVELRDDVTDPKEVAKTKLWALGPYNALVVKIIRAIKYDAFLRGRLLPTIFMSGLGPFPQAYLYRRELANRYPPVSKTEERLDFTYYELADDENLSHFEDVLASAVGFLRDYKKRTGFVPGGLATYFVNRPGTKKYGNYKGAPGISFMMDPITSNPLNPAWKAFLDAFNEFVASTGIARFSLSQTTFLTRSLAERGSALVPTAAKPSPRFITPFLRDFIASA